MSTSALRPPSPTLAARMTGLGTTAIRRALDRPLHPDTISLAGGVPAPETFPVEELRDAMQRRLVGPSTEALGYGPTEGCAALRGAIGEHMARSAAHPDQVLVTNGSQQGLDLVARLLLDAGAGVVVGDPCYLGAVETFRQYQAGFHVVASDADGVDPDALEELLRRDRRPGGPHRLRMLYLVPTFANPTGATTTGSRRSSILAVCARFGLPVVEDDAYGLMRYDEDVDGADDGDTLAALDDDGVVIHLGSFSKVLAPGLRLGWIRAPRNLLEPLHHLKERADLHTAGGVQLAVADLLDRSDFLPQHLRRVRGIYRERRDALVAACARHLAGALRIDTPGGGFFVWGHTAGVDTAVLLRAALDPGPGAPPPVAFIPGGGFHVGGTERTSLRLSFAAVPPPVLEEGVRRLAATLASTALTAQEALSA